MARIRTCVAVLALLASSIAHADRDPWFGSQLSLTNSVSVLTFDEGAEQTYNPFYALGFGVVGQYNIDNIFFLQGRFSLTREITNNDFSTNAGETWLGDVGLRMGATNFYTIPVAGISFSGDIDFRFPTSPIAQARTLQLGLSGSLRVSRFWTVLGGIFLGYQFRAGYQFHEHTTAQREVPLIGGCESASTGCSSFQNLGIRNAEWRLIHTFIGSVGFTRWFGLRVSASIVQDFLFDEVSDARVSLEPQIDEDSRYFVATDIALTFQAMPSLGIAIGASTMNPQLAPDSSLRAPFFNRFTVVYLDLSLNIAGLVNQIRGDSFDQPIGPTQ